MKSMKKQNTCLVSRYWSILIINVLNYVIVHAKYKLIVLFVW